MKRTIRLSLVIAAMVMLLPISASAKTKRQTCEFCSRAARPGSQYCYTHTCHWRGKGSLECKAGVAEGKYCAKHTCKKIGCSEPVYYDTDVQACRYHYKYYENLKSSKNKSATSSSSSSKSSSSSSGSKAKSGTAAKSKTCKYSGCRNAAVSNRNGYCNKHYEQSKKKDDFYYDDFDSYYEDNKDLYDSVDEAHDEWEEEYGED